jgi:hypothetical protein
MSTQTGQDIDAKRWERLADLAGMLGSDHDGERATAAHMATVQLKSMGLTWRELVGRAQHPATKVGGSTGPAHNPYNPFNWGPPPRPERPPPQQPQWGNAWRAQTPPKQRWAKRHGIKLWDLARYAMTRLDDLTEWETNFIRAKEAIGAKVTGTEAEWRVLCQIAAKLGVAVSRDP